MSYEIILEQGKPSEVDHYTRGMPEAGNEHPLRPICSKWLSLIRKAKEFKDEQFGDDATEAMQFFNGPYDFLYRREYYAESPGFRFNPSQSDVDIPGPSFEMTANVVSQMVQIFGPVLYHKNPHRQVNAREIPTPPVGVLHDINDPMGVQMEMMMQQMTQKTQQQDEARAKYIEWYLNYTPNELDLQSHSRDAIDEAIIKGMGCLWTEVYKPKGSDIRLVGSFYDSVDNLIIDADMESSRDALWIARRRVHPVWQVERDFNLPPGSVRGHIESYSQQAEIETRPDADYDRKRGMTTDLLTYWEIYSRMGVGGRMVGAGPKFRTVLEQFGDYAYLVVAEGVPWPLNLPPEVQSAQGGSEEIMKRLEWPTPFWADDKWPVEMVKFHEVPRQVWPMSHLKPGLGFAKFLNWAYSFLASRMRTASRDFIGMRKSAGEEMKDAILHGQDLTLIQIEEAHQGTIEQIVSFLKHPEMNRDMWQVIDLINGQFEKATGLSELVFGMSSRQMRSAEEAAIKGDALSVRPDDMANKVEVHMTNIARKEAIACRWHLTADDIRPIMGDVGAIYWEQLVLTSDIYNLVRQLEYRIEAGSTRKPNRERDAHNMEQAMQSIFGPLMQYAMATGNVQPLNALITDWAKTLDLDAEKYLFLAPPPPPPPPEVAAEEGKEEGNEEPPPEEPPPQETPPPANGAPQPGAPSLPIDLIQQYLPQGVSLPGMGIGVPGVPMGV